MTTRRRATGIVSRRAAVAARRGAEGLAGDFSESLVNQLADTVRARETFKNPKFDGEGDRSFLKARFYSKAPNNHPRNASNKKFLHKSLFGH